MMPKIFRSTCQSKIHKNGQNFIYFKLQFINEINYSTLLHKVPTTTPRSFTKDILLLKMSDLMNFNHFNIIHDRVSQWLSVTQVIHWQMWGRLLYLPLFLLESSQGRQLRFSAWRKFYTVNVFNSNYIKYKKNGWKKLIQTKKKKGKKCVNMEIACNIHIQIVCNIKKKQKTFIMNI